MKPSWRTILLKMLAFSILYALLHFLYDWFPIPLVGIFSGTNESFAQHAKIALVAFTIVSLGEYVLARRRISSVRAFVDARLLSGLLVPWVTFVLWYPIPTLFGNMPTPALEVTYSYIILLIVLVILYMLEADFERIAFSKRARMLLVFLYALSLFMLALVSFVLPEEGFFRN